MKELVIVDYEDIISRESDLSHKLTSAFGSNGLGIIGIRGVPGFAQARESLFSKTWALTRLGPDILDGQLTDPKSLYNAGWSFGKEKLKGNKPDLSKGSFYFNPLTDNPGTAQDRKEYPLSYPQNLWPKEEDLPGFKDAATNLGSLLHNIVVDLSWHIDLLATNLVEGYESQLLYNAMKDTCKAKGRLLYYYPLDEGSSKDNDEDSWIGWHNDSGFLTALAGDIYVDHKTGNIIQNPDPEAGLYVTQRDGESVRVSIPDDCMAVQLGECVQIITGGLLVATPHCVRGVNNRDVARVANPYFIDTPPTFSLKIPKSCSLDKVLSSSLSNKVPPLSSRWLKNGMTFGDFLTTTFLKYYDFTNETSN